MRSHFCSLASFLAFNIVVFDAASTSASVCPLLGPAFPAPVRLTSNDRFRAATASFDEALKNALQTGPLNTTTFSIGMFSTSEAGLVYDHHFTDPSVAGSGVGTQKIDADSVYRIGSISKLLTIYLFLIREGDQRFNDPVTKYIPELAAAAALDADTSNGETPNWNEITLGQLASHMGGLAHDDGLYDISYPWVNPPGSPGLPPIPENEIPTCAYITADSTFKTCDRQDEYVSIARCAFTNRSTDYLAGLNAEPALFPAGSSPLYSNAGVTLLGLVIQNILGSDIDTAFNESIVEALGLKSTSFVAPLTIANAVIPGNATTSGWDSVFGILGPAGGYYSSTNDLATIGRAILNSTQLSKAQTRRWLKPVTFTANTNLSIGIPWEIFRAQVGGRTVDLYSKDGGWGAYATIFVLVPDFDFGFSIFTASIQGTTTGAKLVSVIADMLISEVLPALEAAARDQAEAAFGGHFAASNLNSSLTITVDDQPGLLVTEWISNGTDFLQDVGLKPPGTQVDVRIQPNQLYSGNRVGFTGIINTSPPPVSSGLFDPVCASWGSVGGTSYGNVGIEEFFFEIDPTTGQATCVQPKALRINLKRMADH